MPKETVLFCRAERGRAMDSQPRVSAQSTRKFTAHNESKMSSQIGNDGCNPGFPYLPSPLGQVLAGPAEAAGRVGQFSSFF